MKYLGKMFVLATLFFLSTGVVLAQYGQTSKEESLTIDKKILVGDKYFDNVSASQKTFFEGDTVQFSVTLENKGKQEITNIKVKDILPKYLTMVFYPGNFNKDANTVEWTIDSLGVGLTKVYLINARIDNAPTSSFKDQVLRMTNIVEGRSANAYDRDVASYFIGKSTVPTTGANDLIVQTLFGLSTVASAFYMRKLARGY